MRFRDYARVLFWVLFATELCGGQAGRFTIDRLYSLPSIIGTAPKDVVWSGDSRRIAFLWNDEGTNFYDVWIADANSGKPVRVTRMPQLAKAETDPGVSAVKWFPDGQQLLFTFQGEFYRVRAGGQPAELTELRGVKSEAEFGPTGNELAYLADSDLWVAKFTGKEAAAQRVTSVRGKEVSVESFKWSHDGRRLSFVENDSREVPKRGIPDYLTEETTLRQVLRPFPGEPSARRSVGMVPADGGTVRWVDLGPDRMDLIFGVAWSPDDKKVLVDKSDLYIKDRRLLTVDAETGKASLLLRETDPKNVTAEWWADWAPDGKGVYFTSDRDNDYHVYYVAIAGGELRRITSGDWAVFSAAVSSGANELFVVSNEGKPEERQVFKVPLNGGAAARISELPGTHTPAISPDGRMEADVFSNDVTPPDLYLSAIDRGKGEERQITVSPRPEFKDFTWAAAQYVTFPNDKDGTVLHGRLTLPPGFDKTKKYPAILGSVYSNTVRNQWGGRMAHPTWGLDQLLAQKGYVLLNVDISGSLGHGKAFRQRIGLDYGGVDTEDLYSGVNYLETQGYVDMKRVGIWGSSYGGLLTTMSLFTRPGVYRAGVAGAPATSLFHALTGEMQTMMTPQEHRAQYAASSAYLKSAGLADHLMIIHGMEDQIVLFKDSVTLVERLILEGKDVDFVVLPHSPHSWDTDGLAQTRFAYKKLVDYFDRYLGTN